jgi:hypothetical protein
MAEPLRPCSIPLLPVRPAHSPAQRAQEVLRVTARAWGVPPRAALARPRISIALA